MEGSRHMLKILASWVGAEEFLDKLLDVTKDSDEFKDNLDPLELDEIEFEGGKATNIEIQGLTTLVRKGPASCVFEDGRIVIEADLGVDGVTGKGKYEYIVREGFLSIKLKGDIGAKVKSINCHVKIVIKRIKARLKEFKVIDAEGLEVTNFTGASMLFNSYAMTMINKMIEKEGVKIREVFEEECRTAFEEALKETNVYNFLSAD